MGDIDMKNTSPNGRSTKHLFSWPVLSSIALLVLAIIGVRWVVSTQRAPGAMTITEAQGMDMTTSKPPAGVQPVAVEAATRRRISGTSWFPAVLLPFTDEEVVARIPGKLVRLNVYPGDHVKSGQLLGVLDAPEYIAQAGEARLMARSKLSMATAAMREQQASQAMFRRAQAEKSAAESTIAKAQADSEAARLNLADLRYRNGVSSYLDLLDAQRSLFAAQQAVVQTRLAQLQSQVALYRALGGGWN